MHPTSCLCPMCYAARFETPEVRKTITSPQPTMAEAVQQALAVVGKKYFERGIASQPSNPVRLPVRGLNDVPLKQWARDVWIAEHEAQLSPLESYKHFAAKADNAPCTCKRCVPDIDQINDLLSEISENDRRIQAMQQADEAAPKSEYVKYAYGFDVADGSTTIARMNRETGAVDFYTGDATEDVNAYFDRIKLEAHQARMDRNTPAFDRRQFAADVTYGKAMVALGRAMQQPTQTDLPMNDQVLSARYGRSVD